VRVVVIVGLVIGALARPVRPRRPHRSDLRTPDRCRRWGAALRCARHDALPAAAALPAHAWAAAPPGTIAILRQNGERVMVLSGEIDVDAVQAFEARTGSAGPAPSLTTSVAVADVSAVTFIDCYGLGFLVRCTQSARESGRRPVLRGPTPPVQRVLGLTGLTALFDPDRIESGRGRSGLPPAPTGRV
jgi:anti-anti-sigma factor